MSGPATRRTPAACAVLLAAAAAHAASGDWSRPRHDRCLTAVQPLAGAMVRAPEILARYDLGRSRPACVAAGVRQGEDDLLLGIVNGALYAFDRDGREQWSLHPPGLNFDKLVAVVDLDGDGRRQAVLQAGRPTQPYGAAVVVDLERGEVVWRYDVEPMSYAWYLYVDDYLPGAAGKQVLVVMHGYPPDAANGYMALFEPDGGGGRLRQRWRYDFHAYTCFPSLLRSDVDGGGVREICVVSHSRMWVLDPRSGRVVQFLGWDVSPANVRSYGLVRFLDLDGDGREDFLCIATFAQHHEVLLNRDGRLAQAWHHGWDESVTTGTVASTWPEPPVADVDGDGRLEVVVSMYNAEGEAAWQVRVYDAVTGELKFRYRGASAAALADVDGDGRAEILVGRTEDPTGKVVSGVAVLAVARGSAGGTDARGSLAEAPNADADQQTPPAEIRANDRDPSRSAAQAANGDPSPSCRETAAGTTADPDPVRSLVEVWSLEGAPPARREDGEFRVAVDGIEHALTRAGETYTLSPAPPPEPTGPDCSPIPALVGPPPPSLLAADLDGDGRCELLVWRDGTAVVLALAEGVLREVGRYASSGLPALADVDGDGRLEIVTESVGAGQLPRVEAWRPGPEPQRLWSTTFPAAAGAALPYGHPLYLQAGRFTGRAGDDVYVWAGTPRVRSAVLDGATGRIVWERGKVEGIERYWGPSVNRAASWDVDGDGVEDLVFTNPDYYCVLSGRDGRVLQGPDFPPDIFSQPSQGLYSFPALLPQEDGEPLVCLAGAHYFLGVMSLRAQGHWHQLPVPGRNRAGDEGFLHGEDGAWRLGIGRQDGTFGCVDVATGEQRWELPVDATASDVICLDADGDGRLEFVFATSHGHLWAVGDAGDEPRVVWRADLPAGGSGPIAADLDGDGISELVLTTADGYVVVLK